MSIEKEIRELTGLSRAGLAAWLGVSKSLIQFAEKGERSLPSAASVKLHTIFLQLLQLKESHKAKLPGEILITNPAKLASRHKEKMEYHRLSALGQQLQLRKLKRQHPQLNARLALFEAMKNYTGNDYNATDRDKTWIEMTEWLSKERLLLTGLEQQELIQDKIDVHEAYAELHKKRWEKFKKMGEGE